MKALLKPAGANQVDPLYAIFEQHLFNFQDSDADRKTFILGVVAEYLTYLRRLNIAVPRAMEQPIVEELATQVNTMLVKKIYGCLTIKDFRLQSPVKAKRVAKARYSKVNKVAKGAKLSP